VFRRAELQGQSEVPIEDVDVISGGNSSNVDSEIYHSVSKENRSANHHTFFVMDRTRASEHMQPNDHVQLE
jgi:hypothetical protein